MPSEPHVLLGMPTHDGRMHVGAAKAFYQTASLKGVMVKHAVATSSLLANGCNKLLCEALNAAKADKCTHYAQMHSDVVPEDGWLDTMLAEMERVGADVMAAVIAMKDDSELSSTGYVVGGKSPPQKIPLGEFPFSHYPLPETFSSSDIPGKGLLINTGLVVVDFRNTKIGYAHGIDGLSSVFRTTDRIVCEGGFYRAEVQSEDWLFGMSLLREGYKVFATRKVKVDHWGQKAWSNRI